MQKINTMEDSQPKSVKAVSLYIKKSFSNLNLLLQVSLLVFVNLSFSQVDVGLNKNLQGLSGNSTYTFRYTDFNINEMSFESGSLYLIEDTDSPPQSHIQRNTFNKSEGLIKICEDSRLKVNPIGLDNQVKQLVREFWPSVFTNKNDYTINALVAIKNGQAYTNLSNQNIDLKFDSLWICFYTNKRNIQAYLIKGKIYCNKGSKITGKRNDYIIIDNPDYYLQFKKESFSIEDNAAKIACTGSDTIKLEIKSRLLSRTILFNGKNAIVTDMGAFKFKDLIQEDLLNLHTYDMKVKMILLKRNVGEFIIGEQWGKDNPSRKYKYEGTATYDGLKFHFEGGIDLTGSVERIVFSYDIARNLGTNLQPLSGYMLKISDGSIFYYSVPDILHSLHSTGTNLSRIAITGRFRVDITLPESILRKNGQPEDLPITFKNVVLEMKDYEGYVGVVNPPALKLGQNFHITTIDSNAVVFFKDLTESSSSNILNYKNCRKNLEQYKSYGLYQIPGITIYHGKLDLRLEQIKETKKLHTLVWGFLNLTNDGIYGKISSNEYSVLPSESICKAIPYKKKLTSFNEILLSYNEETLSKEIGSFTKRIQQNIDSIKVLQGLTNPQNQDSLIQIIQKLQMTNERLALRHSDYTYYLNQFRINPNAEIRPREPEIIFHLSSYEILDMKIKEISFCSDTLASSYFIYDVHFPYPSYLDLKFSDITLDRDGYFHKALGPIYPVVAERERVFIDESNDVIVRTEEQEVTNIMNPGPLMLAPKLSTIEITGDILWFWRLPINIPRDAAKLYFKSEGNPDTVIITKCFVETPLLHSESSNGLGYWLSAGLGSGGFIKVKDFDRHPFFGKNKTQDYNTSNIYFDLASLDSLPNRRIADFFWNGYIEFPFFGAEKVDFFIRNLEPYLTKKINSKNSNKNICNSSILLTIDARNIDYSFVFDKFSCDTAYCTTKVETLPDTTILKRIEIASYINAKCLPHISNMAGNCQLPDIVDENASGCRENMVFKQYLRNCIRSDEMIDMIYYDEDAYWIRGNIQAYDIVSDSCGQFYMKGDYIIEETNTGSMTTTTTLFIPGATIYFKPDGTNDSEISQDFIIETDQGIEYFDDPAAKSNQALNIPGAIIINDEEHLAFQLGFPVTSDVGGALPYTGSVNFSYDKKCGYFWFYGDGKFYYVFDFKGQIFIMHCPFSQFTRDIESGIDPLGIIQDRLHLADNDRIKEIMFNTVLDTDIITGVMIGADISLPIVFLDVSIGSALWSYYQGKITNSDFNAGVNIHGAVSMNLYVIKALASLSVSCVLQPGFNPEINMNGDLYLCLIESIFLAHLKQTYTGWVEFSNMDGFDFGGKLKCSKGFGSGSCN